MCAILKKIIYEPLFWSILAALVVTIINFMLFLINRKTFRLLYEKPKIRVNSISLKPPIKDTWGNEAKHSFIEITVINPSSFDNRILECNMRVFPWGYLIYQDRVNIEIAKFDLRTMKFFIDYEDNIKNHNKIALITLVDIKQRKASKFLRLSES